MVLPVESERRRRGHTRSRTTLLITALHKKAKYVCWTPHRRRRGCTRYVPRQERDAPQPLNIALSAASWAVQTPWSKTCTNNAPPGVHGQLKLKVYHTRNEIYMVCCLQSAFLACSLTSKYLAMLRAQMRLPCVPPFPGMSNQNSSRPVLAHHNNVKMMTSKTESSFLVKRSQGQPQPHQQHPVQHCRGAQGARSTADDHSGRFPEYAPPSPPSATGKTGQHLPLEKICFVARGGHSIIGPTNR